MRESVVENEWKAEGRIEGHIDALLVMLGLKFGDPLPPELISRIQA